MTERPAIHRRPGLARTRWRPPLAIVAALLVALVLAACSPPGSGSDDASSDAAPETVSTDIGTEPIELTLYDGAGLKAVDEALIAEFKKKYPNVTITGRYDPDDVQATNAPRVLASSTPPDIARIIALADVVKDRQLTNLDPYAKAYGWDKLPAGQLAQFRVTEDGVRGSGSQYTMADGFTVTGFYYNKDLAQQLGMTASPKTVQELEGLLAKAKAAGKVPIMAGNQTGGVMLPTQMMINNSAGAQSVNNWVFHAPEATINTPEAVAGVDTISKWVKAGYFPEDTNGTDATTALGRFTRGDGVFFPSGNWDAAALDKGMSGKVGFFLPPAGTSGQAVAMSDPASNFGIPAKSTKKDAAAAFLNFLTSPEARQVVADAGFAPSGSGELPQTKEGSVNTEVQQAFADLVAANGQVQFVQNATSGITPVWTSEIQLLVAGKTTPQDMLEKVQSQYETELGRR